MNNLILAMGAEHTNPERLKTIVNYVNVDRDRVNYFGGIENITPKTMATLMDKYDVVPLHDYREMRYVVEEKFDGYSYLNQGGEFYSKRLSAAKGQYANLIVSTSPLFCAECMKCVVRTCMANSMCLEVSLMM